MQAQAVICVDQVANPSAVSGAPCGTGQGLALVTIELPENGLAYDQAAASQYFMFGFGVIVFAYLLGYSVAQVRKPIRR